MIPNSVILIKIRDPTSVVLKQIQNITRILPAISRYYTWDPTRMHRDGLP